MATAHGGARRLTYLQGKATVLVESSINLLLAYIQTGDINNSVIYAKACWNLGSGIDLAVAMNEVPSLAHLQHLPVIVKEVFSRKTESLQPPLMLLMLSIKGACRIGWFPDNEKDDLLTMAKEAGLGFNNTDKMCTEPSHAPSSVSNLISRFYPRMKLESILVSFDVKPGYGMYVADFPLSRGTLPPHCRNLWLLVARVDNMDTSACIASPPNVDFLVNGSEVLGRTKRNLGKGPQLPSSLTKMIKFGINLLQAFGTFDGHYVIVVAFMSSISSSDPPQLPDYVHPVSHEVDSDCDVIEMSSRISLNCPISLNRIRTPVKGHLCKHPQCFDYNNFLEINSRRPAWRCPHCSQPVCHSDLRIDQNIVKILNVVGEDVSDVIISSDGSWEGVTAKKSRSTEIKSNTLSRQGSVRQPSIRNDHTPDAENRMLIDANDMLRNSSSASHISVKATADDIVPVRLQQLEDSHSQAQGIQIRNVGPYTMVPAPLSMQPNRPHPNPLNPTQAPYTLTRPNLQPRSAQADGTSHANIGLTEQTQARVSIAPVQLPPSMTGAHHSFANAIEQLRREIVQGPLTAPSQPQQSQTQVNHGTAPPQTWDVGLASPSGDAMPAGRMRGSLRGNELEQARLQYLAPPRQPVRANEPWSRPTLTLPLTSQMPEALANSLNVPWAPNNMGLGDASGSLPK